MASNKRVFTLRLSDEVFDKIGALATKQHRSMTNYIEFVLLKHLEEVKKAVCGKDSVLVWVLTVLLARGHVLLEDIPGVGKTTMALAFSRALGLDYGRVQFTPDVLPSEITG